MPASTTPQARYPRRASLYWRVQKSSGQPLLKVALALWVSMVIRPCRIDFVQRFALRIGESLNKPGNRYVVVRGKSLVEGAYLFGVILHILREVQLLKFAFVQRTIVQAESGFWWRCFVLCQTRRIESQLVTPQVSEDEALLLLRCPAEPHPALPTHHVMIVVWMFLNTRVPQAKRKKQDRQKYVLGQFSLLLVSQRR